MARNRLSGDCSAPNISLSLERSKTEALPSSVTFSSTLGSRQDVPELLACCDMAVSPSRAEGFSNALLEYMAVGLPTVATEVGGNREIIQHQVNGLLVPPDHPDALGDVIFVIGWRILASRHSWRLPDESGCAPALVSHS